jgi:hypothetical protein
LVGYRSVARARSSVGRFGLGSNPAHAIEKTVLYWRYKSLVPPHRALGLSKTAAVLLIWLIALVMGSVVLL